MTSDERSNSYRARPTLLPDTFRRLPPWRGRRHIIVLAAVVLSGLASPAIAQVCPGTATVTNSACTVTPGTTVAVTPANAVGINASGAAGQITANGITENLAAATTTGVLAQTGATVTFNGSTLQTTATTTATSASEIGFRAITGSTINAAGSSLTLGPPNGTTAASNMIGATAEVGSSLVLFNTPITMLGGAAGLNNMGLLATGAGSQISYSGGTIATRSRASFGVEAINGGHVTLDGGAQVTTTGAGTFNSIAGSYALFSTGVNSHITGTGIGLNVSGLLASGARAENGGIISLTGGTITSTSAASTDLDPASGARALSGGSVMLDGVTINSSGSRGGGFAVQDAGSQATVTNSTITVTGPRSYGGLIFSGGQATVTNSSLLVDTATGNIPVVLVQDAGSTVTLNNTTLSNAGPVAYGLRVTTGGSATMTGGSSTTAGRDAPAIAVSNGSVLATNVALRTSGNDNAMGALADLGGQLTLIGGSVLTTGDAVRQSSFPHALGARNPGGLLTAIGTSVETRGNTAMGAVADDGGTMILSGNSIRTFGPSSLGLFSVTEQVGAQFPANVAGSNVAVETFGDGAHGATAQARNDVPVEKAMITLNDSTVTTHGNRAVGLRAVLADYGSAPSGRGEAAIVANNTSVLTEGVSAHGALSRDNPTSVTLISRVCWQPAPLRRVRSRRLAAGLSAQTQASPQPAASAPRST
jgi:autotransporter family porin